MVDGTESSRLVVGVYCAFDLEKLCEFGRIFLYTLVQRDEKASKSRSDFGVIRIDELSFLGSSVSLGVHEFSMQRSSVRQLLTKIR